VGELTANTGASDMQATGEAVRAALPHGTVRAIELERGAELVLRVRSDGLLDVLALLRDAPQFAFEQLMDLCGVDWPERPLRFEVVYNLLSLSRNQRIRVVTEVADGGSCRASPASGPARPGTSARPGTCTASSSRGRRTCAAC
jgi:NADH:ubiquinone oxidoreductase subunit C